MSAEEGGAPFAFNFFSSGAAHASPPAVVATATPSHANANAAVAAAAAAAAAEEAEEARAEAAAEAEADALLAGPFPICGDSGGEPRGLGGKGVPPGPGGEGWSYLEFAEELDGLPQVGAVCRFCFGSLGLVGLWAWVAALVAAQLSLSLWASLIISAFRSPFRLPFLLQ